MANSGIEYIREAWDTLVNGEENKKKKNATAAEIDDLIAGYGYDKLPEKQTLPDAPTYTRLDTNKASDEQIRAEAEQELAAYKAQGEQGVEKELRAKEEKYRADMQSATDAQAEAERKATQSYESARRSTDDDMLRRGLARSSIAANKQAALFESEASAKAQIAAEYGKQINALTEQINGLDAQRQQALNDFNLSYAMKLSDRIAELKQERDKAVNDAIKYNNTLDEKEHNAAVDKQMKESDLYSEALSQREKEEKLTTLTEKDMLAMYTQIAQKLRGLNKNDARDIVLNNANIRATLGGAYYYKLYDEFCR